MDKNVPMELPDKIWGNERCRLFSFYFPKILTGNPTGMFLTIFQLSFEMSDAFYDLRFCVRESGLCAMTE